MTRIERLRALQTAVVFGGLAFASPAAAQDVKWLHIISVPLCANERMIQCTQISQGKVELLATTKDYLGREIFLVRHNGVEGFVSGYYVTNTFYLRNEDPAITAQKEKAKAASAKKECERRGGVKIGMTADEVKASCWGNPARVNQTITARGKHEQWVYRSGYVYLENGTVTSIQTSR